ncbi:MAG: hypothetical protein OXN18_01420 [Gemmatimonadota bacterium]|nr:hypothetical protein [Gemmatimonadota bacterium]
MIRRKAALAQILAWLTLSCADPPTFHLPLFTQFPVDDVRLGMTFADLRQARSEIMLVPDSAMVVEELFRGRYHYAFTSQRQNRAPSRGSRLVYIDRVDEEVPADYARRRWDSLVVALAEDLGMEPRCSAIEYGRLNWRRATLREDDQPVAGAVDVVGVTIGDPGPGEAELITRVWLTEFVSPISPLLDAPELARSRLPAGEADAERDCIDG